MVMECLKLNVIYVIFSLQSLGMVGPGRPAGSRSQCLTSSFPPALSLQTALRRSRTGSGLVGASTSSFTVSMEASVPPAATAKAPQSSTRPSLFLLGHASISPLTLGKLPKNRQILQRFFGLLQTDFKESPPKTAKDTAAEKVFEETMEVWKHHFGLKVIEGKELDTDEVDEKKKMIVRKSSIKNMVLELEKKYNIVEYESRRIKKRKNYDDQEENIKKLLEKPLNILKQGKWQTLTVGGKKEKIWVQLGEEILRSSGII